MSLDPVATNPDHYRPIFENEHVRVLEYTDEPGDVTTPHDHPASVLYTVTAFRRRLVSGDTVRDVDLAAGQALWLAAQRHHGENIGTTPTHAVLVEFKVSLGPDPGDAQLGPGPA